MWTNRRWIEFTINGLILVIQQSLIIIIIFIRFYTCFRSIRVVYTGPARDLWHLISLDHLVYEQTVKVLTIKIKRGIYLNNDKDMIHFDLNCRLNIPHVCLFDFIGQNDFIVSENRNQCIHTILWLWRG